MEKDQAQDDQRGKEDIAKLRLPSCVSEVMRFTELPKQKVHQFPLYISAVRAGFPSPADDYIEDFLDLNDYLISHPAATFIVRAAGDSMTGVGIQSGDILIVDRSLEPTHGRIVIAAIDGELTVKRLACLHGRVKLMPASDNHQPIDITDEQEVVIWGVVKHVIHSFG